MLSVYNLLNIFSKSNIEWLPFHKDADKYESMSRSDKNESLFRIVDKENQSFPIKNFVWSESRTNLSIKCKIIGEIDLDQEDKTKFGVETLYSHIWRNYTVIRDGKINIKKLILKINLQEAILLSTNFKIDLENVECGIYSIDLTKYPVINESDISTFDLEETYEKVYDLLDIKYNVKILNHLIKSLVATEDKTLSEFESLYEKYGLGKDGSYSPTKEIESAETSDFYLVKQFEFQLKGYSAIPAAEIKEPTKSKPQLKMNDKLKTCPFNNCKDLKEIKEYLNNLEESKKEIIADLALLKIFLAGYDKPIIESYKPKDLEKPEMIIKTSDIKVYI